MTTTTARAASYFPQATPLADVLQMITAGRTPATSPMLPTILASSARDGLEQLLAGPGATTYR